MQLLDLGIKLHVARLILRGPSIQRYHLLLEHALFIQPLLYVCVCVCVCVCCVCVSSSLCVAQPAVIDFKKRDFKKVFGKRPSIWQKRSTQRPKPLLTLFVKYMIFLIIHYLLERCACLLCMLELLACCTKLRLQQAHLFRVTRAYIYTYIHTYIRTYGIISDILSLYVCMYVCMYVCVYVCV
jgi:hypothetical protein